MAYRMPAQWTYANESWGWSTYLLTLCFVKFCWHKNYSFFHSALLHFMRVSVWEHFTQCVHMFKNYICVCLFISLIHYVSGSKSAVERARLSVSICQCVSVCNHVTLCKTIWMCQHVWTYLNAHVCQHPATLSTSKKVDETQPFQNSQLSWSL